MKAGVEGKPTIYTTMDTLGNHTGSWRYLRPSFTLKSAPCSDACPAGNPISKFMVLSRQGLFDDALRAVKMENPFPSVCGRVCPHPCATACNRGQFDSPLSIHQIERVLGDAARGSSSGVPDPLPSTGRRIAVIGAGPAGLSCAYHSALIGHSVTVYELRRATGGLLRSGIPEYRLARAAVDSDLSFISELGIEIMAEVDAFSIGLDSLLSDYDTVCVATGAGSASRLEIEGADLEGVVSGRAFLEAVNGGSRVAPGKKAIVIGGGNTAMDAARSARRMGAEVVAICVEETPPALEDESRAAAEEGVSIICHAAPVKILGSGGRVAGAVFRRLSDDSTFEIDADAVIAAIGDAQSPEAAALLDGIGAEAAAWGATNAKRIYQCGDAGPNNRTVAHAIGSGKRCAIAMDAAMNGRTVEDAKKMSACGSDGTSVSAALYRSGKEGARLTVSFSDLNAAYFKPTGPLVAAEKPATERLSNFDEINVGLTKDAAMAEAARCFNCGCCDACGNCFIFCPEMSIVRGGGDELPDFKGDYCKGCGICARECPRGIIEMTEEEK